MAPVEIRVELFSSGRTTSSPSMATVGYLGQDMSMEGYFGFLFCFDSNPIGSDVPDLFPIPKYGILCDSSKYVWI
jgi:hypothetical protein